MNTFLNILPWALAILAGVLYFFSRQNLMKSEKEIKSLEGRNDRLASLIQNESQKTNDLKSFFEKNTDIRFVNSAVINLHSITLRDMEIIHENHIKVIRSLASKGYFRQDIADRFNYRPKTGNIEFSLFEFKDDIPIRAKDWQDFLIERNEFKKTVTEYIEGVIGQREINRAVEEAIENIIVK